MCSAIVELYVYYTKLMDDIYAHLMLYNISSVHISNIEPPLSTYVQHAPPELIIKYHSLRW